MRRQRALLLLLGELIAFLWLWRGPLPLQLEVARFIWQENLSGASVAVQRLDGAGKSFAFGSTADGRRTLEPETMFSIASLSKPLTAAAVRRLIDGGRLQLDDRLFDVLPELKKSADPSYAMVTIRQLLQHTAGLAGNDRDDPLFSKGAVAGCDRAVTRELRRKGGIAGGQTVYSNVGYCVLGQLLALRMHQPYGAAMAGLLELDKDESSLIFGFPPRGESATAWVADRMVSPGSYALLGAAGGWFSDARTLARVLAKGVATEAGFDRVALPGPAVSGRGYHYGLGWRVPSARTDVLTHFGVLPGTFAVAVAVRGKGVAVALFSARPADPESASAKMVSILARSLSWTKKLANRYYAPLA